MRRTAKAGERNDGRRIEQDLHRDLPGAHSGGLRGRWRQLWRSGDAPTAAPCAFNGGAVVKGQGFAGTSKPRVLGNQGVGEVDSIAAAAPIDKEGAVAGFSVFDDHIIGPQAGNQIPNQLLAAAKASRWSAHAFHAFDLQPETSCDFGYPGSMFVIESSSDSQVQLYHKLSHGVSHRK